MYRYDWYIVSDITDESYKTDETKIKKVLQDFNRILTFLDNSHIKKMCGDIALEVVREGAYYGYIVATKD